MFYNVADVMLLSGFVIPYRFLLQLMFAIAALAVRCILIFHCDSFFLNLSQKFNHTQATNTFFSLLLHFFLQKHQFMCLFSIQSPHIGEIAVSVCCENAFLTLY